MPEGPRDAPQNPQDADRPQTGQRLTVAQAADQLGISEDAVRSRVKRGTIKAEREFGTVYVLLDGQPTEDQPTTDQTTSRPTDPRDELIAVLREQLASEREANRENRRLLLAALERPVRELESGDRSSDIEEAPEDVGGSEAGAEQTDSHPVSWWRRLFGQ
jgi:hypothetical protein